jgi:hypothetical protein
LGHSLSDGDGSNSKSLTLSISQFNAPRLAERPSQFLPSWLACRC